MVASVSPVAHRNARAIRPLTSGFAKALPHKQYTVIVWGGHPKAVAAATQHLAGMGVRVVERSQVEHVFNEQRFRLQNTSEVESDVLQVGKMLGADHVVIIDVTGYLPASIAIRGVSVQSGEILRSGTAQSRFNGEMMDEAVTPLTNWAIARAFERK